MLIINFRDNENNRCKRNAKKEIKYRKEQEGGSYSENVRADWFCCAFEVGFFQLTRKAYLIFKSNLELALLIIVKEKKITERERILWRKVDVDKC